MGTETRAATVFTHVQDTASATWVISHHLDSYPIVDVYVTVDGNVQKIYPESIVYVDGKTCNVTFSEATAGFAAVV